MASIYNPKSLISYDGKSWYGDGDIKLTKKLIKESKMAPWTNNGYMKATTAYDCGTSSNSTMTLTYGSDWTDCTSLCDTERKYVIRDVEYRMPSKIPAGENEFELPDGSRLKIDKDGNYQIDDFDAKVVYKANRMRDFSPHLNASDMLADFVRNMGEIGVRKEDVLNLPIHLFISWLVIEAAERDGDPCDVPKLTESKELSQLKRPHCLSCGRFIRQLHHRNGFPFCSPDHASKHLALST